MFKKKGSILMTVGLVLLTAAVGLAIYNVYEDKRAEEFSGEVVLKLKENMAAEASEDFDYKNRPDKEMPTIKIDGERYIGIIEIPDLGISLPVFGGKWDYNKLLYAPCIYSGSVYEDNMVLAAHNYSSHFGGIRTLPQGSEIRFTDADGNLFTYETAWPEVLQKNDTEEMKDADDWDLTLFTCTYGGRERFTLRCVRTSN